MYLSRCSSQKLGRQLWLSLPSLLSWNLNTWKGGEPWRDSEEYQYLRGERKIFKGEWEDKVGEVGMHPEASLKWREGVVKCHQILNWVAFVSVRSSSKWWENKYPFGNVVTQNWKLQEEHLDEGMHKPSSSGSQGDSSINTNYKIHTRTRNEWWVISIRSDFELLKVKVCVLFTNIFEVTSLGADISFHKFLLHI